MYSEEISHIRDIFSVVYILCLIRIKKWWINRKNYKTHSDGLAYGEDGMIVFADNKEIDTRSAPFLSMGSSSPQQWITQKQNHTMQ